MKNIKIMDQNKYHCKKFDKVGNGIYKRDDEFFMTLSFIQEPRLGEGENSLNISQYPLEDILDKYFVYISDFYIEINNKKNKECILEFASSNLEDIKSLAMLAGKHVYNKLNGNKVSLIIE